MQTTKRQKSTNKPTNHISQFWSCVCKFLASNRALFYMMQDSCTKKTIVQESTTHSQVSCTSRFVQVSCTRFLTVCHEHKVEVRAAPHQHSSWGMILFTFLPSLTAKVTIAQKVKVKHN